MYVSDPSGNYSGWKATAIGANHQAATNILKQDYKDNMSLDEAVELATRVLSKSMDSSLSPEKVEMCTLSRNEETKKVGTGVMLSYSYWSQIVYKIFEEDELTPLLETANKENAGSSQL